MKRIWMVTQHREGRLNRGSWETIAAGQRLAEDLGGVAEAILLGHEVESLARELAGSELGAVRVADDEALASYTPGGYVGALAPAIAQAMPDLVLFSHTYQSSEYVPRLAEATGAAHLPEAISYEATGDGLIWKRPILEGKLHARVRTRGDGPALVTLQSGAFPADARRTGHAPIEQLATELGKLEPGRRILGTEKAGGETVDLGKAEVIVAVGRGVGGADKLGPIEELARALRAEIGASRPVIDNGWLPRDRQIGSSGQTVAPKLYVAVGISGAIQHLVGMKGSTCIVAINKDPSAPIFKVAHYGVVGDLHEVVPALTEALRAEG
jgi:electron transfer flavoprotein alpha subunit